MGRWEPDARGRMAVAALELYSERGFEQTTVQDIAARAGVTERTFFRHFADKREVLFDGSATLERTLTAGIADAPDVSDPVGLVGTVMEEVATHLEDRHDYARRRAAVVAGTSSLQERELLKLAGLADGAAAALRDRGVTPAAATVAGQAGVLAFRLGFERWIDDDSPPPLARCIRDALAELRSLTAP